MKNNEFEVTLIFLIDYYALRYYKIDYKFRVDWFDKPDRATSSRESVTINFIYDGSISCEKFFISFF